MGSDGNKPGENSGVGIRLPVDSISESKKRSRKINFDYILSDEPVNKEKELIALLEKEQSLRLEILTSESKPYIKRFGKYNGLLPGGFIFFSTLFGCVIKKMKDMDRCLDFESIMSVWASCKIPTGVESRFQTDVAAVLFDKESYGNEDFLNFVISKWKTNEMIIKAVILFRTKKANPVIEGQILSQYAHINGVPRIVQACVKILLARQTSKELRDSFEKARKKRSEYKDIVEKLYSKWADENNQTFDCDDDVLVWLLLLEFYKNNAEEIFPSEVMSAIHLPATFYDAYDLIPKYADLAHLMSNKAICTVLPLILILEAFNSSNPKFIEYVGDVLEETFGNNIFFKTLSLSLRVARLVMALCVSDSPLIEQHLNDWWTQMRSGSTTSGELPLKNIEGQTSQYWLMVAFPPEVVIAYEPEMPPKQTRSTKILNFLHRLNPKSRSKKR